MTQSWPNPRAAGLAGLEEPTIVSPNDLARACRKESLVSLGVAFFVAHVYLTQFRLAHRDLVEQATIDTPFGIWTFLGIVSVSLLVVGVVLQIANFSNRNRAEVTQLLTQSAPKSVGFRIVLGCCAAAYFAVFFVVMFGKTWLTARVGLTDESVATLQVLTFSVFIGWVLRRAFQLRQLSRRLLQSV
jgi:hypothetical protein